MTLFEILLVAGAIWAATKMGDVFRFEAFAQMLDSRRPRAHEFE